MIKHTTLVSPGAGAGSRSQNFSIPAPAPAKSSSSLRLQLRLRLHNTAGESWFHISTPQGIWTQVPCDGKQRVSPLDQWDMVRMKWDCRLSTGLPPSSRLCRLWSRKGDLQRAWNRDRKAVWDQVGLSHCQHEGLVKIRDEARLRRGHNDDQSGRGHQCSKTTLTGESRFHISTPQGIWTQVPCDGKQRVSPLDQWDIVRMKWDFRLSTMVYSK